MFMSMESYQTQIHILIDSLSIIDDSNEALKITSNFYPALVRNFSSHLEMRMHRISSPLTRSDRFSIDRLITSIHTSSYLEYSIHVFMPCMDMN